MRVGVALRPHLDQPGREGRGSQGGEWEGEGEEETKEQSCKRQQIEALSSSAWLIFDILCNMAKTERSKITQCNYQPNYGSNLFRFLQLWRQERCWGDILCYDSELEWIEGGALLGLQVFTVVK